jgi:dephospho-CoA kinase
LERVLNLKKVAVTGGLASGKSSLCRILKEFGSFVVDTDQIVHKLFSHNDEYVRKVVSFLGNEIVVKGKVNRKRVAAIVFQNREKLKKLESITHPLVRKELKKLYLEAKKEGNYSLFVVEMPLLFETEDPSWYDATVAVQCKKVLAKERFCASTGREKKEYDRRMARQLTSREKARRATYCISNNGTLATLRCQAVNLYNQLIKRGV